MSIVKLTKQTNEEGVRSLMRDSCSYPSADHDESYALQSS